MPRDDMSRRQISRHNTKVAGDRSSKLSRELMKLQAAQLAKLELDEELLAAIERARGVTAMVARRRAERTLAGVLRGIDIDALRTKLANVQATGAAEPARLHLAERWRARLLDEGPPALAEFLAGAEDEELPRLISAAQRERIAGKPPGAGRALFRHITEILKDREDGSDSDAESEDEIDDADDE